MPCSDRRLLASALPLALALVLSTTPQAQIGPSTRQKSAQAPRPAVPMLPFEADLQGGVAECSATLIDFEGFANGEDLQNRPVAASFLFLGFGPNAGPAIFDSDPGGPNANVHDQDLLVGSGKLVILQTDAFPQQTSEDVYDAPNDDADGGTLALLFFAPVEPLSIDLIDICPDGGLGMVTLTDESDRQRIFVVPPGYTNDLSVQGAPGALPLRLDSLELQPGVQSTATATEDPGFNPVRVVRMEVFFAGSGAIDNLRLAPNPLDLTEFEANLLSSTPGSSINEPSLGDFNNDGLLDLAWSDNNNPFVTVAPGRPGGSFSFGIDSPGVARPTRTAAADFDGDGILDLALGSNPEQFQIEVTILRGLGDGSFEITDRLLSVNTRVDDLITADFEGDGDQDVILISSPNNPNSSLLMYENDGLGNFTGVVLANRPNARHLLAGDVNADGHLDLVVGTGGVPPFQVIVYPGDGLGGLETPFVSLPSVSEGIADLKFGDWDGDHVPDLLVSERPASQTRLYQTFSNNGSGFFHLLGTETFPPLATTLVVGVADVDGDGFDDILHAIFSGVAAVRRSRGDGTFERRDFFVLGSPRTAFGADLDGNGLSEVVFVNSSGAISIWSVDCR